MRQATCVWPVEALLGEGPVWHPAEQALWFTDIKSNRLHRYDPATGGMQTHPLPGGAGFLVPAADGALVLGMGQALHHYIPGGTPTLLAHTGADPSNRINDGTTDPDGRIWFGTMHDAETHPTGAVHMYDGERVHLAGGECTITNGPAITADGTLLYHVDTQAGLIWRFSIADHHTLRRGTIFARIPPEEGYPDGVSLDAGNNLWVCLWGGSEARRYAPDGTLLQRIPIPASQVTKLALGGPGLRTAYVTTARIGLSPTALAAEPLAGGLFHFEADVPGLPATPARLP